MWLTADECRVNGTKHGSDLSIFGGYITFALCKMFITMTVIILWIYFGRKKAITFYCRPKHSWVCSFMLIHMTLNTSKSNVVFLLWISRQYNVLWVSWSFQRIHVKCTFELISCQVNMDILNWISHIILISNCNIYNMRTLHTYIYVLNAKRNILTLYTFYVDEQEELVLY